MDDQRVVTRPLELVPPPAARLRAGQGARQRALGADPVAAGAGQVSALQDAGSKDQQVVRPQRIGAGRQIAEKQIRHQGAAAHQAQVHLIGQLFDPASPIS